MSANASRSTRLRPAPRRRGGAVRGGHRPMLQAVRRGATVGALVAALVLIVALVPAVARGYPLALLPLLAAGPVAAHGSRHNFALVLLRGAVGGLVAAVAAVAALVFSVEVLDARLWALTSPASSPPMPALPQPRFLPGLSWPQADILLLLPPLAAVLAGVYHVLLGPPEARLVEALARRVAA